MEGGLGTTDLPARAEALCASSPEAAAYSRARPGSRGTDADVASRRRARADSAGSRPLLALRAEHRPAAASAACATCRGDMGEQPELEPVSSALTSHTPCHTYVYIYSISEVSDSGLYCRVSAVRVWSAEWGTSKARVCISYVASMSLEHVGCPGAVD